MSRNQKFITPLGWGEVTEPPEEKKFITLGFLPTWMVGKTRIYGDEVDRLVFSAVPVEADGSLVWDSQSKKINNDDYLKLKEAAIKAGKKNILGIKQFDDKKIDKLMADDIAKTKLAEEVAAIVKAGNFDGVNIDFEYMSNPARMFEDDFLEFYGFVKGMGWGEVSTDVFANTIIKGVPERIAKAADKVDMIVVMAYDFHRPGSRNAGPVAPLSAEPGERNISEITEKIISNQLDGKKFILAYPLYGYEWQTAGEEYGSPTEVGGYGRTVFYREGIGMSGVVWDEKSKSPWAAWTETERRSRITRKKVGRYWRNVTTYYTAKQWHQAYFENEQSLAAKIELAKISGMKGVGYWALGYEGKESELLKNLNSKL